MDFGFSLFPKLFAERSDFPLTTRKHSYEGPEGGRGAGGGINPIFQPKCCPNPISQPIFWPNPSPRKVNKFSFEIKRLVVLFIV